MPSAKNKRNRRMRKLEAGQKQDKNAVSQNSLLLSVAVKNNSTNNIKKLIDSPNSDTCSVCNGQKCDDYELLVGCCGSKFGKYCLTFLKECPKCELKIQNNGVLRPQESFSRNVAGSMVEVGELASLALEDLSTSASNFMTSWSDDPLFRQNYSRFGNPVQPMNQRERDAAIRNVQIAKTIVGTTAAVTGYVANGVGCGLWLLGSLLSPVIRGVSKQILSEWNVDKERADHMVDDAMEIAKAAVLTTGSVARGVQNSSAILASGTCRVLARMYENAHGFQPGELEYDVGEIARNTVHTAWNVNALKPKSKLTKISKIYPAAESKYND